MSNIGVLSCLCGISDLYVMHDTFSAVNLIGITISAPVSYNEVPTDPECRIAVILDNSRSVMCNVQTNRLTDGVLGDSKPINFDQFSAWNRLTNQPRIYFQFLSQSNQFIFIRQIDLYFYRNTKLQIGLPNVQLHISDQATPAEDQYRILPYTIISNQNIPANDNQAVKVSLIPTFNKDNSSNNMLVRITFDFSQSETLNWMLLSEVTMFNDTSESLHGQLHACILWARGSVAHM